MPVTPRADPQATAAQVNVLTPAVVALFASIASQAALIAALLYFFGRTHTNAFYGYFGVDSNSLGFANTDYVLRSLNTTLPPVIASALAILAILAFAKHVDRIANLIQERPWLKRTTAIVMGIVIVLCVVIVVNGISDLDTASYSRGYPIAIAVLGIAVAVGMGRRLLGRSADQDPHRTWSMTVAAFALAGVLWVTDLYAAADGEREARDTAHTLLSQTSIEFVLYSANRLALDSPPPDDIPPPAPLTKEGNRYHFRYSGLRLLIRTPREYVILPARWRKGSDPVIIVPVDDSTRFDVIPHCVEPHC